MKTMKKGIAIFAALALCPLPAFAEDGAGAPAAAPETVREEAPAAKALVNFPASGPEAFYESVEKYYAFDADDVCEFRSRTALRVNTLAAVNQFCGETFIVYNPHFQRVKINAAYTLSPDGATRTDVPENAFSTVLPRCAEDAPAFDFLRELVVTHTALEPGATIFLDYSVFTKSASESLFDERADMPFPCARLVLNFNGAQTEHFDVPARPREPFADVRGNVPVIYPGMPRSAAPDFCATDDVPPLGEYGAGLVASLVNDSMTRREKLAALAEFVRESVATAKIPEELLREADLRDPDAVLRSAYGVPAEKARALRAMFVAVGENDVSVSRDERDGAYFVETAAGAFPVDVSGKSLFGHLSVSEELDLSDESADVRGSFSFSDAPVAKDAAALAKEFLGDAAPEDLEAKRAVRGANSVEFSGTRALKPTDGVLVLKLPHSPKGLAAILPSLLAEKRVSALELPTRARTIEESAFMKIRLADGWEAEGTPGEAVITSQSNAVGEVVFSRERDGDELVFSGRILLRKTRVEPEEYPLFRELVEAFFAPANSRLVLVKKPARP
ncbi:MAG: DUF3857 domain-containing protein [Candidatus Spyradosoma sp.]